MSIRHTLVSTLHTQAELAAFPFSSEAALSFCVTRLSPELTRPTSALWRAAETQLVGESPALSLDELGAMRDALWFATAQLSEDMSLAVLLREVAHRHLEVSGRVAQPSMRQIGTDAPRTAIAASRISFGDAVAARQMWRWLSFALPPDLLLAALDTETIPREVFAVAPTVAALLTQERFAEMHVHQGAAMSFDVLWASAMKAVAHQSMKAGSLASPGAALGEGNTLAPWLLRAAIGRYVLASYLARASHPNQRQPFNEFLLHLRDELAEQRGSFFVNAVFERALGDLRTGKLSNSPDNFASVQSLYAGMTGVRATARPQTFPEIFKYDPLYRFSKGDTRWTSPEVWFVSTALAYLSRPSPARGDRLFEELFWQVVRVRCLTYRHVVQRPMTPGLQWFVRVYNRLKPLRTQMTPRLRSLAALDVCGQGHGLAAIELRIGPESSVQGLLNELRALEAQNAVPSPTRQENHSETDHARTKRFRPSGNYEDIENATVNGATSENRAASRNRQGVETGYIVHFIRDRGGFDQGTHRAHWRGSAADPSYHVREPSRGNPTGYRYAQHYIKHRRQALVLARTLTAFPVSLELLRGIDLCTDEVGVPTWVMAPLLRYVCDASKAASVALHQWQNHDVPPMRKAVHAGEDFVHLMSGMRRLHQSIRYFGLGAGDRIGHGLALGLEPERWAKECGRIAMSREDRLFDLTWAWTWLVEGKITSNSLGPIEHEIRELCRLIFEHRGADPSAADIAALVDGLHQELTLREAGFPNGPRPSLSRAHPLNLVVEYLTSTAVFRKSKETIWVDPEREAQLLGDIQDSMRQEAIASDITVEVNPTSNLLIGHVPDLRNHPLWRLAPGPHKKDARPPLPLCVGSDDPITFSTTLPQEYQLLYDALVQDGASTVQALDWIDRVRRTGMQRRFTVPRSKLKLTDSIPVDARLAMPP